MTPTETLRWTDGSAPDTCSRPDQESLSASVEVVVAAPDRAATADDMTTLTWLIIGGGIHGVHIAARLLGEGRVVPEDLGILDPGDHLLARWRNATSATGMTHLRSPSVHHLALPHDALQRFAGKRKNRKPGAFAIPFERPSLELFNAHCDQVERTFDLEARHIKGQAVHCSVECDAVRVRLECGRELEARNVVLALGSSDQPNWPSWAPRDDPRVRHIFDRTPPDWPARPESIVVVGGGISAGHVALRLIKDDHDVHLISRHPLQQHQFDSDPGWLGWKYTELFTQERDVDRRRSLITDARHTGSVPPDMGRSLRRAIARGKLHWHQGEVTGVATDDDALRIMMEKDTVIRGGRILLATGFDRRRPGGAMVDDLIASASLPCATCGYPIVDDSLRWHSRVFVSGPLAELELGPVSRNIAGARRAGDRIVDAIRSGSISDS